VIQVKAIVEPDAVADDFTGKTMVPVTLGVGWRGHIWLPIMAFDGSLRSHHRGDYVMGWERRATT
jgi:hypothetical protein